MIPSELAAALLLSTGCAAPTPAGPVPLLNDSAPTLAPQSCPSPPACVTPLLIATGDSITAGYGLTTLADAYPFQTAARLGDDVLDEGANGYRIDQITALWEASGHARLAPGRTNIVTCMGGINDVLQGADAVTIESRIAAYAAAVRSSFAALPAEPRNLLLWGTMTASATGSNAVRLEVNAYLRANFTALGFDGIFDGGRNIVLGTRPIHAAYFVDSIHPNAKGQGILAGLLASAVTDGCGEAAQ